MGGRSLMQLHYKKWRLGIFNQNVGIGLDRWHNEITILRLGFLQIGRVNH